MCHAGLTLITSLAGFREVRIADGSRARFTSASCCSMTRFTTSSLTIARLNQTILHLILWCPECKSQPPPVSSLFVSVCRVKGNAAFTAPKWRVDCLSHGRSFLQLLSNLRIAPRETYDRVGGACTLCLLLISERLSPERERETHL